MTLSTGGTISGTPTAAGSKTFTVRATDSASQSATASLTIVINAPALTVTTSSLPGGTVGTPYSQTLAASGGTPPYTWALATGTLPAGLTLSTGGTNLRHADRRRIEHLYRSRHGQRLADGDSLSHGDDQCARAHRHHVIAARLAP